MNQREGTTLPTRPASATDDGSSRRLPEMPVSALTLSERP